MMILSDKRVNEIIKSVTNKLGLTKQEKEPVPMIQKAVTNISKKDKKSDVPFAVLNQQK